MQWSVRVSLALATVATLFGVAGAPTAKAQEKKPNILVIMGDDVGWFNVGAYHRGIMSGKTPNPDPFDPGAEFERPGRRLHE